MTVTTSVARKVKALPDSHVALVVQQLFQQLFSELPRGEVQALMTGIPQLDAIKAGGEAALGRSLSVEDSVALGRELLLGYANEPDLAPLVEHACDGAAAQMQDKMFIGALLATGVVVNLTYLVMTTSVRVSRGADGKIVWKIVKRASPPEFVAAILKKLIPVVGATH